MARTAADIERMLDLYCRRCGEAERDCTWDGCPVAQLGLRWRSFLEQDPDGDPACEIDYAHEEVCGNFGCGYREHGQDACQECRLRAFFDQEKRNAD